MRVTVKDFCELQGFKSQVEANSVINLLHAQGIAVEVGKKVRPDGRGRAAKVYEIPQEVTLTLFKDEDMSRSIPSETENVTMIDSGTLYNEMVTYFGGSQAMADQDREDLVSG